MNLETQSKDKGIALKAEVSASNVTPYFEDEIMMLTRNFGKFLPKTFKASIPLDGYNGEARDKGIWNSQDLKILVRKKNYGMGQKGKGI